MTVHDPVQLSGERTAWRLSVKDFELLENGGSFADYAKAELLDGEIWVLNAIHSRHAAIHGELQGRLWAALAALGSRLRTYVAPSIAAGSQSRPEPDIAVGEAHEDGVVPIGKARLLVEISDTTLDIDLGRKRRIYAEANVPEYWVVDTAARLIHQHWAPLRRAYQHRREIPFGEEIVSTVIAGLAIRLPEL